MKSEKRIHINSIQTDLKELCFFLCFLFLFSACVNINEKVNVTEVAYGDPSDNSQSGNFRLLTVLPSQGAGSSIFDFVGQNSEIENYCGSSLEACRCEYSYLQEGIGMQTITTPVVHQEADLVRCANIIPSGIGSFEARILASDGAYTSNGISVSLNNGAFSGSTSYIDLTDELNFLPVRRFQCRKHEFVPNPLDPSIIDVFQSEDPRLIYAFNFYSANLSQSLLSYQKASTQDWECSLNSTSEIPDWANEIVFSASTCSDPSCSSIFPNLIYPRGSFENAFVPTVGGSAVSGKSRSSFHLAKSAYGVFQTPVQAAIAPNSYQTSNYGVIGYAAKPIPSNTGISTCPAISLPERAYWVKLWNFRATNLTPKRKFVSSISTQTSAISCVPDEAVFPNSCKKDAADSWYTNIGKDRTLALANPTAANAGHTAAPFPSNYNAAAFAGYLNTTLRTVLVTANSGSFESCHLPLFDDKATVWEKSSISELNEFWYISPWVAGVADENVQNYKAFPWGSFSTVTKKLTGGSGVVDDGGVGTFPSYSSEHPNPRMLSDSSSVVTVPISEQNFTDQLFVTTPVSVNDNAMRNNSPTMDQFKPLTYRSKSDCETDVPCGGLSEMNRINWEVNTAEVGNAQNLNVFPLCVLQFNEE